jgi:anti-sigma factor RsiW
MDVHETQLCSRARFWASLRIDGELSQLEGALLDAHLANCESCREVTAGFESGAALLRAVPVARVAPVTVSVPRSPRRFVAAAGIAAVLAAGVIAGGLVRGETSTGAQGAPHAVAVVASFETPDQLRRLRRTTLLSARRIPRDLVAEPV